MPWTSGTTRTAGLSITAAIWNAAVEDNNTFLKRVGFQTYTADATINTATVGTAVQIVSLGAITYTADPHYIEFYTPHYAAPAQATFFILRDSTTVIGTIARTAVDEDGPIYVKYPITPTAASHTYNIAAWNNAASTGTVNAGTGGAAGDTTTDLNGWMAASRVPT